MTALGFASYVLIGLVAGMVYARVSRDPELALLVFLGGPLSVVVLLVYVLFRVVSGEGLPTRN